MRSLPPWVQTQVCLAIATVLVSPVSAQSVRGTVVDAGGVPVAGVVVRLLNADSTQAARALTNERGEFLIRAAAPGAFHVGTMRIGYRPVVSDPVTLGAGEEVSRRITLAGIPVTLDGVRIAGRNSCGRAVRSQTETFELLEQVRAAIAATELTGASRTIASTSVSYSRTLDPTGMRTVGQQSTIVVDSGGQPWRAVPTDSLRRSGYVQRPTLRDSTFYFAPGLETLASDEFILDHCFRIVTARDTSRLGIAFEPIRERSRIAEVRGTLWLDRGSMELRSMDYRYVNVDREIGDAGAGGEAGFVRMKNGGWVVSGWSIRMPVFQVRVAPAQARRAGGNAQTLAVVGFNVVGGQLSVVTSAGANADTLWSRPPLVVTGTVVDSTSGSPVANARLSLHGATAAASTDARGAFTMTGVLPGHYTLQVRTASLDSVNAVNALAFAFTGDDAPIRIRAPNATHVATALCGAPLRALPPAGQGMIFGSVVLDGDTAVAAGANVVAEWLDGPDDDFRWKEAKADARGNFRFCGVPIGKIIAIRAMTDSGGADAVGATIPRDRRFARADLSLDLSVPSTGVFAGLVVLDSANNPVADAEVVVQKSGVSARTNRRGAFRLRDVPVGPQEVTVRKLGYGPMTAQITFAANQTVTRRIVLSAVQMLSEVTITAERMRDPLMRSFEENRKIGLGKFLTREDLATFDVSRIDAALRSIPSLKVIPGGRGASYLSNARGVRTSAGGGRCYYFELLVGQTSSVRCGGCYASVYLDRQVLFDGRDRGVVPNLQRFAVDAFEAVEYYPSGGSLPAGYSNLNSACGVLILHTRRFESASDPKKKPPRSS